MNTKNKIIESIIHLPQSIYIQKGKPIYDLLRETGYFEQHNSISEKDISQSLSSKPNFIYDWISWSESKRVTSGWFIQKIKDDKYKLGYFPVSENIKSVEFSNGIEACAAFIKREIEEIRNAVLP